MSFKKPFRAMPVQLGAYQKARKRRQQIISVAKMFATAVAGGLAIGALSAMNMNQQDDGLNAVARDAAVSLGLMRRNTPIPGAYYPGCDAVRAAEVAPLYAGEPGYRVEMDGDRDGVACEPYR